MKNPENLLGRYKKGGILKNLALAGGAPRFTIAWRSLARQ
jgi:hypothetical protein